MNWNEIGIIRMVLNALNIGLAVPVTLGAITYTLAVRKKKRSPHHIGDTDFVSD